MSDPSTDYNDLTPETVPWLYIIPSYSISLFSASERTFIRMFKKTFSSSLMSKWTAGCASEPLESNRRRRIQNAARWSAHHSEPASGFTAQTVTFRAPLKHIMNCVIYLRTATETWRLAVLCGINNTTVKWREKTCDFRCLHYSSNRKSKTKIYKSNTSISKQRKYLLLIIRHQINA